MSSSSDTSLDKILQSKIYTELKAKCASSDTEINKTDVLSTVNKIINGAAERAKVIIRQMPEYTLHDETHFYRVLILMDRIIPESTLKKLSVPELMLLILSAFLHDIGMAPEEKLVRAWKQDWEDLESPTDEELNEYKLYQRFRNTYPQKIKEIKRLHENERYAAADRLEGFLITEYIRNTHVQRAREVIAREAWLQEIKYKDTDLKNELTQLCFSHGRDTLSLLDLEVNTFCDENSFLCLPFLCVILRLADILDFDAKRTPSVLFSHLSVRNPVSLAEWQKHRSVYAWIINGDIITFNAKCEHPAIEKSIHDFCDIIDEELKNCSLVLSRLHDPFRGEGMDIYKIKLPAKVDRSHIQTKKDPITGEPIYLYKDTAFKLNKNQVIDLLMGTKLYDDTKAALRELIQNSIDACLVAQAISDKYQLKYEAEIIIRYYTIEGESFLEVEDNGVGMNQQVIDNYYSRIGSSYYRSKEFTDLKNQTGLKYKPISRFGIGILSCFMVSDTIEVETRKLLDDGEKDQPYELLIQGYDSIFTTKKGSRKPHGTKTSLVLRAKENPWDKMTNNQFIAYVQESVPNPPVRISIVTDILIPESEPVSIDQFSFKKLEAESLKYYYWNKSEFVREIPISLNDEALGFTGEAIVAILEKDGLPQSKIEGLYRKVKVDSQEFDLENKVQLATNEINQIATVIEVGMASEVKTKPQSNVIVQSKAKLSIHGIEFPNSIFPEYYDRNKQTKIKWKLPMLMVLDITGENDIDLNSARTEMVFNEKWNKFEENLAYIVCRNLKSTMTPKQWNVLAEILINMDPTENFKSGLLKAQT
jgi:molecular chaperone HtpG